MEACPDLRMPRGRNVPAVPGRCPLATSTEVADRVLARAVELGYGQRDIAALYEVLPSYGQ